MRHAVLGTLLVICLALLSAGQAFTQTDSFEIAQEATAAPVAYVYVQTPAGVNLYNAAADGQLALVKGSPFKTSGEMIGSTGQYFITLGTTYIHSYAVGAGGVIQHQVSTINTQSYPGGACGTTNGARLDHTGRYLYVGLWNGVYEGTPCSALQSFAIAKGSGALSFINVGDNNDTNIFSIPTISSTGMFGYSVYYQPGGGENFPALMGFKRAADGGLDLWPIEVTEPTTQSGYGGFFPWIADATPNNYFAAAVYYSEELVNGPLQLASYKIESNGNLISTNTWKNVVTPTVCPTSLYMSPAGNLLTVAGNEVDCGFEPHGSTGLQLFHFNGANPITSYGKPITTASIDQVSWDSNNHLYALSKSTNKLYVYTVTPTKVTQVSGSPYTIPGLSGLLVVRQ